VYKSVNGGNTWRPADKGLSDPIESLTFDPSSPGVLYAGGTDGVFKSTDQGKNLASILTDSGGNTFVIDPQDPRVLYAADANGDGWYASRDAGLTWSPINSGLNLYVTSIAVDPKSAATPTGSIEDLAFDPRNSSTLYLGTWVGGAYKS